jgi:hypothetical protein
MPLLPSPPSPPCPLAQVTGAPPKPEGAFALWGQLAALLSPAAIMGIPGVKQQLGEGVGGPFSAPAAVPAPLALQLTLARLLLRAVRREGESENMRRCAACREHTPFSQRPSCRPSAASCPPPPRRPPLAVTPPPLLLPPPHWRTAGPSLPPSAASTASTTHWRGALPRQTLTPSAPMMTLAISRLRLRLLLHPPPSSGLASRHGTSLSRSMRSRR